MIEFLSTIKHLVLSVTFVIWRINVTLLWPWDSKWGYIRITYLVTECFSETCVSTNILPFLSYWKINFIAREWENESANIHSVIYKLEWAEIDVAWNAEPTLSSKNDHILFLKTFSNVESDWCGRNLKLCIGKKE